MKVVKENLLSTATLSNVNTSVNYPVDNLAHFFLEKRYQVSGSLTDTITAEWDSAQSIDCLFVGFHTLTSYTARFYDYEDSLLETLVVSSPEDIDFQEFTQIDDVWTMEIDVVFSAAPAYIGGICCNLIDDLGEFESNYPLDGDDTSDFVESSYGQTLQTPRADLKEFVFNFYNYTLQEKDAFMAVYDEIKKGKPVFFAIFNQGIDDISPLYGKFTRRPSVEKNGRRFDIEIRIKEAG